MDGIPVLDGAEDNASAGRADSASPLAGEGAGAFRLIFDNAAIGIFQATPQGRFVRANRTLARMLGYATPDELVRQVRDIAAQTYANPADRDTVKRRLAETDAISGMIVRGLRRDGGKFWARVSAVAVRDAKGAVRFHIGTSEDVTEHVEARAALERAEAEYREIFENVAEGIYRSSPDGRQLRANPALVALNGYASEAEMLAAVNDIGREWYVDPARRAEFARLLERDGAVRGFESEIYRHKTRERIWIVESAWLSRTPDGAVSHYNGTVRDVTARRRAEEELRRGEQRFRDFADTASDWFWETDAEYRVATVVGATGESAESRDYFFGRRNWEIAADTADEPEKWVRHKEKIARREAFRNFGYCIDYKGRRHHILINGKPVFDAAGEFSGYRGTAKNVSKEVAQERELRDSEQRFRDFADIATDWFWETDDDHRLTYVSSSPHQVKNAPPVALGKRRWELAADFATEVEKWAAHRRALDRRESFRDLAYAIEVSGHGRQFVSVNGRPMFDAAGRFTGYRGTARNVTAQVEQRAALARSEARLRDFAEISADWLWETDSEHRFSYFSGNAARLGANPANMLGKRRWDVATDAGTEPEKWAAHRACLDRRETFRDFLYRIGRGAMAEPNFVSVSGRPIFGEDGAFQGYRGTVRIVTGQVRAEAALRAAKIEAERASESKSDFLANMSHELRTPLNAVIGFAEMMERKLFGPLGAPRYEGYVRDIRDSAQHLLRLIEDILDLSKAEAGRAELSEERVDLGAAVDLALHMVGERARRGSVALTRDLAPGLPGLRGDVRRIRQILLNLVSNAVKFTPPGGQVRVSATPSESGGLRIVVTDTGIGIAEADQARVFEPFVQIRSRVDVSHEGTGLGLPLTRQLVEMHGGTIGLQSRLGQGTTVAVDLPAARILP